VSDPSGHDGTKASWGRWLGELGAFALPLIVYLLTLAPTITWAHDGADGGDLITAAYTLGVPHPPGYPTYCLLGRLFAHLPLRDVAWRLNLLSAVGAGLAALGLYLAVLEWRQGRKRGEQDAVAAGLGAAWGLAFVPMLWSQALIAEVYAVNAAFVALILWLAFRVRRSGVSPAALGLAWGLSLGTHPTSVALLPIVAWALATGQRGRSFRSMLLPWLSGAVLGLCTYVYLPLRAGRGAVTWGDPTTPAGWWWVVSGVLYRGYVFALPLEAVPLRLLALTRHLASGFGPIGVALGAVGLDSLARRQRGFLLASGLSWLLYVAYSIGYDTADSYVYLIPALVISALWLSEGLAAGLVWLRGRLARRWDLAARVCLVCVGPLFALVMNYSSMDVHRDTAARDFGEEVLAAAPRRAVLLSAQDAHTFTLWYFQHVLRQRSDVAVVDTGLLGYDWYRAGLLRAYPGLIVSGVDANQLGRANPARPICEVVGEENYWLRCSESE
jgi:hypothetical protein